ncbi:MAG: hypothetical protein EBV03_08330 [Proteobacteria bacterium]|nr:hypothetical protein [Pseudomonadota bacterium]
MKQPAAQQEEGFWTKTKRSVKGFFSGVIKAAPMTMLYTGAVLTGSAALGTYVHPDLDFLTVIGNDGPKFVTRLVGGTLIGSTLSGAINGIQSFNAPEPQVSAGGQTRAPSGGKQRSTGMNMNDVVLPFTPQNGRTEMRAK